MPVFHPPQRSHVSQGEENMLQTQDQSSEQPKQPHTGHESDELSEKELDEAAGGTVINPQPLPPRHLPQ
jgi:hypothetical protein